MAERSDEKVVRPDGRVYRPRKGPEASVYATTDGDTGGVVVIRTHDVERARALAAPLLEEHDLAGIEPEARWMRLGIRDGDLFWEDDPKRGAPALVWDVDAAWVAWERERRNRPGKEAGE